MVDISPYAINFYIMLWNRIIRWFRDLSERRKLINAWNESAREAYISGAVPSLLEVSTSIGNSAYRHEMSKWMMSGFRIKVKSGRPLMKEELLAIGRIILYNTQLVRRIVVLGWDTLEVYDASNKKGVMWAFKDFMDLRLR